MTNFSDTMTAPCLEGRLRDFLRVNQPLAERDRQRESLSLPLILYMDHYTFEEVIGSRWPFPHDICRPQHYKYGSYRMLIDGHYYGLPVRVNHHLGRGVFYFSPSVGTSDHRTRQQLVEHWRYGADA